MVQRSNSFRKAWKKFCLRDLFEIVSLSPLQWFVSVWSALGLAFCSHLWTPAECQKFRAILLNRKMIKRLNDWILKCTDINISIFSQPLSWFDCHWQPVLLCCQALRSISGCPAATALASKAVERRVTSCHRWHKQYSLPRASLADWSPGKELHPYRKHCFQFRGFSLNLGG